MSSSACERFVFDVCSANPNICKICKNNKAMHTDLAPVKRDSKFGFQVQAHDVLKQFNSVALKVEKKTPVAQYDDKKLDNQESSRQQTSLLPAPTKITGAKPNDVPKSPQPQRNEVVQSPISLDNNDIQRKTTLVWQLIRDQEEKIKSSISIHNQYNSTPKRGSQASNTPSQRPSIASACQSNCSGDSPTSQKSSFFQNFSNETQKLQDSQQEIKQQQDENSNQLQSTEKNKANENNQNELKKEEKEPTKIDQKKDNTQLNSELEEQQNQQKIKQEQINLKQKQEKEILEQQKIEKEKLANLLQKQSQEAILRKDEKPKPIQQNKGLTLAEILARQKQKIEQGEENKNVLNQSQQQNQTQQPPKVNLFQNPGREQLNIQKQSVAIQENTSIQQRSDNLTNDVQQQNKTLFTPKVIQTVNTDYSNIQKQVVVKEDINTPPVQQRSNPFLIKTQVQQQDQTNTEKVICVNQNQIEKDNLQKQPVINDAYSSIQTIQKNIQSNLQKPEEKDQQLEKEQKPQPFLGTVAQRIQDLQKQKQQQQLQQNSPIQKVNITQKVTANSSLNNQKTEEKKELQPRSDNINLVKQYKNEIVEVESQKDKDQKEVQEVKKTFSLIQQLQSQLGNLNFGAQTQNPSTQNKIQEKQPEEGGQNDKLDIPFLKEQNEDQRQSVQDLIDRPVMKKNVRSSRKVNFLDVEDD